MMIINDQAVFTFKCLYCGIHLKVRLKNFKSSFLDFILLGFICPLGNKCPGGSGLHRSHPGSQPSNQCFGKRQVSVLNLHGLWVFIN